MKIRPIPISRKLKIATLLVVALLFLQFTVVYYFSFRLIQGLTEIHLHQKLSADILQLRNITESLTEALANAKPSSQDSSKVLGAERDQSVPVLRRIRELSGNYPDYSMYVDRVENQLQLFNQAATRFTSSKSRAEDELLIMEQYGVECAETEDAFKAAVERRGNELFSSLYAKRHQPLIAAIIITGCVAIFAILVGLIFTRKLELSIENLARSAHGVSEGNLDIQAPILSNDEIGLLTKDFNFMTRTLKQTTVSRKYVQLLADASVAFARSIDQDKTIRNILEFSVPRLGKCCLIHLMDDSGKIISERRLFENQDKARSTSELGDVFAKKVGESIIGKGDITLHTGPFTIPLSGFLPNSTSASPEAELFRRSDIQSFIVCPLIQQNRLLGVLSIGVARVSSSFDDRDLALHEELARRASAALENSRLYHEAREAVMLRDEFLSIASHELKTPLTSLSLNLQVLEQQMRKSSKAALSATGTEDASRTVRVDLSPRTVQIVSGSVHQSQRLADLLDELLDLTRIRLGKLQLAKESVDLNLLVRNTVERFSLEAAKRGILVSAELPGQIMGEWDPMRIEQVVSNLLSNALKYGSNSPVSVRLSLGADGKSAVLVVSDRGMGIPPEERERIFERFERAGVTGRQISGLGLGLYICRQIIEAHGGTIHVESEVGKGSSFVVQLPLALTV